MVSPLNCFTYFKLGHFIVDFMILIFLIEEGHMVAFNCLIQPLHLNFINHTTCPYFYVIYENYMSMKLLSNTDRVCFIH